MACSKLGLGNPLELLEPACLKYAITKCLGYGIVAGSAAVKLPQILKIMSAGNVAGLSGSAILIEMFATIASFAYYVALGYPFSTWGENLFLFVQNCAIGALFFKYTAGLNSGRFFATFASAAVFGWVLYKRLLPDMVVPAALCGPLGLGRCTITCADLAGGLPIVMMLFGRVPQIVQNQRQGHAGQLALVTYALNVAGAGARVFTTMQELDDKLALFSAASSMLQNLVLVLQILLLGPAPSAGKKAAAAKAPTTRRKTRKTD